MSSISSKASSAGNQKQKWRAQLAFFFAWGVVNVVDVLDMIAAYGHECNS